MPCSEQPANSNPEVEAWFQKLEHPLSDAMLLVRQYILETDERITEAIKWSAPTFNFQGNIVSFQPRAICHSALPTSR